MGFSHETTTHHFLLHKTGGSIDGSANDPKDSATRDEIRMHLSHIAKLFAAGDFDVPMFIHDTTPPGAPMMAKLRSQIRYVYTDTPRAAPESKSLPPIPKPSKPSTRSSASKSPTTKPVTPPKSGSSPIYFSSRLGYLSPSQPL
jgi:hypothetical protein